MLIRESYALIRESFAFIRENIFPYENGLSNKTLEDTFLISYKNVQWVF